MSPADTEGGLRLRFLGPPEVTLNGGPVDFDTRKATALLAYLAVTGRTHRREALAALLYPDYDQERAYANLRRTLWSLHTALGKAWLEADRETIGLVDDADVWSDVEAFRRRLAECRTHGHSEREVCSECLRPLAQAAALYRDDFLAGFTLPDSVAFDEWQFFEMESLRQELASALGRLVSGHRAAGDMAQAIAYARRWLALDPLHEPAHRQLMQLYAQEGRRAAALRQYETCVRTLDEELGVEPEAETVQLYEAIEEGALPPLPVSFAATAEDLAETTRTPIRNLPAQPAPFVGRVDELAKIDGLLGDPACRLLTLVGPGGVGKTSLALRATEQAADAFSDGVCFVSLAPVESSRFLVPTIADELDFSFFQRAGAEPRQQLLDYLREKELLLILDNFEHLIEGAGFLVELLAEAPRVKLLVTSRERLHLRDEFVFDVEGMRFPRESDEPVETLASYSAVRLFLERAERADAGFAPTEGDWAAIADICQLLEGLPLGIELAATWVRMLSCPEIAGEIEEGLDFLSTTLRDVPERHRSLRAVVDRSWQLLSERERSTLAQLAVFRGGFQREAAAAVVGADLSLLAALADKSLIQHNASGRYGIHEAVRRYAAERLRHVDEPDEAVVRDRHSRFYTTFVARRTDDLHGPRQVDVLAEVGRELENVRAAWGWAVARRHMEQIRRAAKGLAFFFGVRSLYHEGEAAFREAAAALDSARDSGARDEVDRTLGLVLIYQGYFAHRLYREEESQAVLQRSLDVLQPLGRGEELATADITAVQVGLIEGVAEAEQRCRRSLEIFRSLGNVWGIGTALQVLSAVAHLRGDVAAAKRHLEEAVAFLAEAGDRWSVGSALFYLGSLTQHQAGGRAEAKQIYEECLRIGRELSDCWAMAISLDYIGYLAREMGAYEEAERLHEESLDVSREIGDRLGVAGSLDNLGLVARDVGDMTEAEACFREGLGLRRQVGKLWEVGVSLRHMGDAALGLGDLGTAERWYRESLDAFEGAWESWGQEITLARLAEVVLERGEVEASRRRYHDALQTCLDHRALFNAPRILVGVARLLAGMDRDRLAVALLAYVREHPFSTTRARKRAERLMDDLAAGSPTDTLEVARERFRDADLEAVVELLIAELST